MTLYTNMKTLYDYICEHDSDLRRLKTYITEEEDEQERPDYEFEKDYDDDEDEDEEPETEPQEERDEDDEDKDVETIDINGFVVLKPGFVDKESELRSRLEEIDWEVVGEASKTLTEDEAKEFYANKEKEPYFDDLVEYMSSDESKCFMLWKKEAAKPIEEIRTLKEKLRAEWAENDMKNALHSPDTFDDMERELQIFLNEPEEEDEDEEETDDFEDFDEEDEDEDFGGEEDEDEEDTEEDEDK